MQTPATAVATPAPASAEVRPHAATFAVVTIASLVALAHLLTNSRYGIHRDELEFLVNARHLDWGYVAYPPLDPFIEHIALSLFGLWLVGLRLFSVIAQWIALFATGLMARDLGGGRLAQIAATLCVALSALPLFNGTEFQYTSFDFLWWVLIAWSIIRLLRSENPRWWLAIGVFTGLGVMTKYSIVFYIAAILGGFILTRARRYLLSPYFLGALAITTLIALPNIIWQVHHHFISYTFLHHIHVRDVGEGRADGFLLQQFWVCTNPASAPLWIAGLLGFFFSRRYRVLGWTAFILVALFFFAKGRGYYTGGVYPMLMAMGGVQAERWLPKLKAGWRYAIEGVFFTAVALCGAYMCAIILPIASSGPLMRFAFARNGDLREETGWKQIVQTVASIRDSLPPEQRDHLGIIVGNYGEAGAIEILGPAYQLPLPISGTNSAWYRGYPSPPPSTLILLGFNADEADRKFTGCRLAGHVVNPLGLRNEESVDHPDIFVCGPPRQPWPEFWKKFQRFG